MCFLSFVGPDIMDTWCFICTDDRKVEENKSGEERGPVAKGKKECGGVLVEICLKYTDISIKAAHECVKAPATKLNDLIEGESQLPSTHK